MASPRNILYALGTALYVSAYAAAVPLDIGVDVCLPFGIQVGLFIDLFEPPQITEVVPIFATATTTVPSAGVYTVPSGTSVATVTAHEASEMCITSVTTKTTTYPCSTSTSFTTTWWDPCISSSSTGTCRWTPPATSAPTTITATVTATITESATSCVPTTPTATLSCDPYGYLIQYATLYRVDLTTGDTTQVSTGLGDNTSINSIGYNVLDNYIYGYQSSTGTILRISADGTTVTIDADSPPAGSNIGDVDTNGHYWVGTETTWAQIDLAPGSATYGQTLANGTTSTLGYAVADWVYIPDAGEYMYAVGSVSSMNETALLRFDLSTHEWESVADYGALGVIGVGAVYGMNNGTLYASENGNGQIWQFPVSGDTPFEVSQGPASGNNDGARCVLNLLA
ncbi:hypothetical protein UA08_03295 [Talaromyces atroroseus]|uniref:DUF6923 domain-containing protein n=1 Tax=Talaromyces atroroseus TaxID=1441469 RepID=A0A225AS13_TALAT|nr:hypothetical protein UA08_03295 [Talaromyces atroroseus]OKL61144.1 hypothetical protein UA08_03295 [Talaromyces atroroseus]